MQQAAHLGGSSHASEITNFMYFAGQITYFQQNNKCRKTNYSTFRIFKLSRYCWASGKYRKSTVLS